MVQRPRPTARGKFLFVGDTKFYVKGATYGAFEPDENGVEYHDFQKIEHDFELMVAAGINTVRIPHTTPPRRLLDVADKHGLRVMVGLSAEQYVGYLIDRGKKRPNIERTVQKKVSAIAGHPALLCYAIGNEIAAPVVRWLGPRRIERFLHRIHRAIKSVDPAGLVTYVNYPTTEYLQLPFLDVVCFNVYLELPETFRAYLLRLHNIAGDRPLIMSELGLDALRNGEEKQASALGWQIRTSFNTGSAGVIVFSWTDEWFRAEKVVDDWAFGLTDAQRKAKPALAAVNEAFAETPCSRLRPEPLFSVVICTYNGANTIRDCLEALNRQSYRNFEIIVVNDGSSDATGKIAAEYDVRIITTKNQGLSRARNIGWQAARGEYIAYIDDDAYPDEHWLEYLAPAFLNSEHVAIGGPNVEPPESGSVASCVANAPGGPVHVLLTDELAEHIPGCNMVIRRWALETVGGFDPQFRAAGDDVDFCWRLQERGWTLGFNPAAMVWHHQRNTIRAYWRQQRGYGRAEALLESKWPAKYNVAGHHTLSGRIYGKGFGHLLGFGRRIYHGVWGTAPYQLLYQRSPGTLASLPTMPEWYLIIAFLALVSALGFSWRAFFAALPLLFFAMALTVAQAWRGAARASFGDTAQGVLPKFALRMLTALLHLIQPLARLIGRVEHGLTFWRRRGTRGFTRPRTLETAQWTENWVAPEQRMKQIEESLCNQRVIVLRGHEFARWDLEVRCGMFGAARLLMAVEDHGGGAQYVRCRAWPLFRSAGWIAALTSGVVFVAAAVNGGRVAALVSGMIFAMLLGWAVEQAGVAIAACARTMSELEMRKP